MGNTIVVDLVKFNNVRVDPVEKEVWFESGCYLDTIDAACEPHCLATTVGTFGKTGSTGLILNGGWGWMAPLRGNSVENILEITAVLSTGEAVKCSETENADLFWALRGGGGNFCFVTSIKMRLYPVPEKILSGMVVYLTPTLASQRKVLTQFLNLNLANSTGNALAMPSGAPVTPTVWCSFEDTLNIKEVEDLQKAQHLGGWFRLENSI